jgi:hypothetical protein
MALADSIPWSGVAVDGNNGTAFPTAGLATEEIPGIRVSNS